MKIIANILYVAAIFLTIFTGTSINRLALMSINGVVSLTEHGLFLGLSITLLSLLWISVVHLSVYLELDGTTLVQGVETEKK
ncbi:MAG: hypothetical protein HYW78_04875 [Parcubacteria group bacterium]|nr:hypothetical protein [Parcubacteria group bacterium]